MAALKLLKTHTHNNNNKKKKTTKNTLMEVLMDTKSRTISVCDNYCMVQPWRELRRNGSTYPFIPELAETTGQSGKAFVSCIHYNIKHTKALPANIIWLTHQ